MSGHLLLKETVPAQCLHVRASCHPCWPTEYRKPLHKPVVCRGQQRTLESEVNISRLHPSGGCCQVSSPRTTAKHRSHQPVFCESTEQLKCIHAHISQPQTILFSLQRVPLTLKCPFPVPKICLGCLRHTPKFYEVSWFFDPLNEAWKGMAMDQHS